MQHKEFAPLKPRAIAIQSGIILAGSLVLIVFGWPLLRSELKRWFPHNPPNYQIDPLVEQGLVQEVERMRQYSQIDPLCVGTPNPRVCLGERLQQENQQRLSQAVFRQMAIAQLLAESKGNQ